MITAENILSHEFIGLNAKVSKSTDPQLIGLNGTIVDETKSMFKISTHNGIKSIPKNVNQWKFTINNQQIVIDGTKLAKRSYDRLGGKI